MRKCTSLSIVPCTFKYTLRVLQWNHYLINSLCQVDICFSVCIWSLDVFSFDESFNPFLDDDGRRLEPGAELFHNLCDKLIVIAVLSTLHDSNDASLDLVLSILVNFLKLKTKWKQNKITVVCCCKLNNTRGCDEH